MRMLVIWINGKADFRSIMKEEASRFEKSLDEQI